MPQFYISKYQAKNWEQIFTTNRNQIRISVENTRSISQKLFDYESALQALEGNKALINLKEKLSSNNLSLEVFLNTSTIMLVMLKDAY